MIAKWKAPHDAGTARPTCSNVRVDEHVADDVVDYKVSGRFDSQTAANHQQELMSIVDKGVSCITLDLSGVTHLSTAGIRVLLMVGRAAQVKSIPFELHSLPAAVSEIVRITGLAEVLTLREA